MTKTLPLLCALVLIIIFALFLPAGVNSAPTQSNETLWLDGTGYVRIRNNPGLNPAAVLTLEAWVNRADDTRCETLIGKDWTTNLWLGFCTAKLRFYAGGGIAYDSNTTITDTQWTHVAVTLDSGDLKFYINGMLDRSIKQAFTIPSNTLDWVIGADYDGSYPFMGSVSLVRIWDRALGQSEIQQNMSRQIETAQPGLLGQWILQANAEDTFGHYPGQPFGGATFTAPPPPTHTDEPIRIPTLPDSPTMDGTCNQSEYGSLRLPIWVDPAYGQNGRTWVYVMATSTQLYVCMERIPLNVLSAEVYLDLTGNGGSAPQWDDYRVRAIDGTPPTQSIQQGNGAGWIPSGLTDYQALFNHQPEFYHSAEFRIPRSFFSNPDVIFRMQLQQNVGADENPLNDYGWPVLFDPMLPSHWLRMQIDPNVYVRPDSANPEISSIQIAPAGTIHQGDNITFFVTARDDVDLAQIDMLVDGTTPIGSCGATGLNDREISCTFPIMGGLPLGQHEYYARAWDHRSRIGTSARRTLTVQASGDRPRIYVSHTPVQAAPGHSVTVHAVVTDTEGVTSINIGSDLSLSSSGNLCEFSPAQTIAVCDYTFTPPTSRRIVYYWVTARDLETFETTSARIPVLFGNAGPDDDADGLSNSFETLLGTHPSDPDSDQDTLLDGYEVMGMYFPGDAEHFSDFTNLPAMGANPRYADVFVQYDYEDGTRYEQRALDWTVNLYRRHYTALHISTNWRPRSGATGTYTSTLDAESASYAIMPGTGQYYFKPIYNWTHNYVYSNFNKRASSYLPWYYVTLRMYASCPAGYPNPQTNCPRNTDGQAFTFMHELGHELGLGHGGRTPGDFYREVGGFIHYGTYSANYDQKNYKPNYFSSMNYFVEIFRNATLVCFNPSTNAWLGENEYTTSSFPTLVESALDERPTSTFATALRAKTCNGQAGFEPVTVYFCQPPGSTRKQLRITNGLQTVLWTWINGNWTNINIPSHADGIDWNCDGVISTTPVSSNINNSDPAEEGTLAADIDWSYLPAGRDCTIGYNGSYRQPSAYRDQIRGHDCSGGDYGPYPTFPLVGLSLTEMLGQAVNREAASFFEPSSSPRHWFDPLALFYNIFGAGRGGSGRGGSGTIGSETRPNTGETVQVQGEITGEVDPADLPASPLPNFETCDGMDNDGDEIIDESCPDTDGDNVVDVLDTCPQTYDPDQSDLDGDTLGDACQYPQVWNASAMKNPDDSITLSWEGTSTDILGFNVYRMERDGTQVVLGATYPSASGFTYTDFPVDTGPYVYIIRAVNLNAVENGETIAYLAPVWVYLPLVVK